MLFLLITYNTNKTQTQTGGYYQVGDLELLSRS